MKKIMIVAAALVAMTACNKTLIEGPVADSEYGYINFGLSSDMEIVDTKAVVSQTGDGANYNVYLKKGSAYQWSNGGINYKEYSAIDEADLTVPAATDYVIEAENYTETEAEAVNNSYGAVRVKGTSAQFAVAAGETTNKVTVQCTPVNAKVTVAFAEGFTDIFNSAEVTLVDAESNRSLEMNIVTATYSEEDKKYTHSGEGAEKTIAYFNVDESTNKATISWSIKATIGTNAPKKTFTSTFEVEKNKWSMITFKAGKNGNILFEIDATTEINAPEKVTTEVDPLTPAQ